MLRKTCTQRYMNQDFHPQASEIIPGIYLADMYTATDPEILRRLGITHVISVVKNTWYTYPPEVKHLRIAIADLPNADLFSCFDIAVEWIQRAIGGHSKPKVMIHCVWGMSRSASVLIDT